ncbi:ATP synthase regulation protein NCA2-domain-containing protein [Gautieria morchelliformis]|nr:ATP synthase regulation protein NCA2-domain-containing protein [Gautieria morchelliformis]
MSTFATHQTEILLQSTLLAHGKSVPSSPTIKQPVVFSARTQKLHSLLATFNPPISPSLVQETVDILKSDGSGIVINGMGEEQMSLRRAAVGAVAASLFGQILDMMLQQATEADSEANWWAELERSRRKLAWYLLETLPLRLKRVVETITHALRSRNLAVTPSAFTPNSIRQLFPSTLRPSRLAISFFPHLSGHSRMIFRSPFELTRQECQFSRQALEAIRDDRAERLGRLTASRPASLLKTEELVTFIRVLQEIVDDDEMPGIRAGEHTLIESLSDISNTKVPKAYRLHNIGLSGLRRPSRVMRLWPRLVIIPPITLILFRLVYGSRETLGQQLTQAIDTVSGFWTSYLLQPVRDILDTVRTGGEEGVRLVSVEGVKADIESLERMAVALSKEKYQFGPTELEGLSMQIRRGDLTPILKVYEEDLKSPLKSAVSGTLIRSLLIQIQKMKVDVDFALSGIDKLLRSQELTFAFVGVAPALAIVYAIFGWARGIWQSGHGRGRYGGRGRRQSVWLAMRRIERCLVLSSSRPQSHKTEPESLSSLEQGLILLSVAQLRAYGEKHLPARSRLREEFLVDVSDLEDSDLRRKQKMNVVKRMWRSWGGVLEWSSIGEK